VREPGVVAALLVVGALLVVTPTVATRHPVPAPRAAPAVPAAAPPADAASVSPVDDAARLLAGLPLSPRSAVHPLSTTTAARAHAVAIDAVWRKVTAPRVQAMRTFATRELVDIDGDAVFYPFGGPDILNATALFPSASTYMLLGLEPVGPLPSADLFAEPRTLALAQKALSYSLRNNIFITVAMAGQLQGRVGVAALLAFFLARNGYALEQARLVTLAPDGSVVDDVGRVVGNDGKDDDDGRAHGVEFVVRRHDRAAAGLSSGWSSAPPQRVRYFSGNVNDEFFSRTPGLVPHLLAQGSWTTMLKAASYLMYYPAFDDIRALVLARSDVIVTDTSGLPFHRLAPPAWQVSLYGTYHAPIRAFTDRCQPDLEEALRRSSRGELPFSYGYSYRDHNHLVVARRALEHALADPTDAFDGTKLAGENTRCVRGVLRVDRVAP